MKLTLQTLVNRASSFPSILVNFAIILQALNLFLKLGFISIFICSTSSLLFGQYQWKKFGDLQKARHLHSALPIDANTILVMGGFINSNGSHSGEPTAVCENIELRSNVISQAASMVEPRAEFVALAMPDSNIIVVSGVTTNGALTSNCEIYDRNFKTWRKFGSLLVPRRQHTAQFINSSEILVVGGRHQDLISMNDAEIFNILNGTSRKIAPYPVIFNVAFGAVSSLGDFVLCGGRSGGPNSSRSKDVFKYDSALDTWIKTSELINGVGAGQGIRLWNGQLLFSGGSLYEEPPTSVADIFLETNNSYNFLTLMQHNRAWHSIAQWNSDTVVIFGGFKVGGAEGNGSVLRTCDWVGLKTKQTYNAPKLLYEHAYAVAVSLPLRDPSGNLLKPRVLAISGLGADNRNTATVEILEAEYPPVVSVIKSSCTAVDVTISHFTQLDSAWLVESASQNVTLDFVSTPAFPSLSVGAWIRLKNPLKPGTYTLRAQYKTSGGTLTTDYSGIIEPKLLPVTITTIGSKTFCEGSTLVLDAGADFASYQWSNGQTSRTVEISSAGKYSVMVMSYDRCYGTDTIEIDVRSPRSPVITASALSPCYGDSVVLDAGSGFVSYNWSTGEATPSVVVRESGTYSVTTTDEYGCNARSEISVAFKSSYGLEMISSSGSGNTVTLESVFPPDIHCRDITFKNTLNSIYLLEKINIAHNIEFSVPQSQFPIVFQPGEERVLSVCFSPGRPGQYFDTLLIGEKDCDPFKIALFAEGLPDQFTGISRCNIPLIINPLKNQEFMVSRPFPNPTHGIISVLAEFDDVPVATCFLKDILGNTVQNGDFLKTGEGHGIFTVSTSLLATGIYTLHISTVGAFKTFSVIVE